MTDGISFIDDLRYRDNGIRLDVTSRAGWFLLVPLIPR
jgi:hypothetical protein